MARETRAASDRAPVISTLEGPGFPSGAAPSILALAQALPRPPRRVPEAAGERSAPRHRPLRRQQPSPNFWVLLDCTTQRKAL